MKSIYESPKRKALALLDEENGFFVVQLIGDVSQQYYRAAFLTVLKLAREHTINQIIINTKELKHNPDPSRQWLTSHFLRRLYKYTGAVKLAIINPKNTIERTSVSLLYKVMRGFGIEVDLKFFDHIAQAQSWITEIGARPAPEKGFLQGITKNDKVKELKLPKSRLRLKLQFSPQGRLDSDNRAFDLPKVNLRESIKKLTGKKTDR